MTYITKEKISLPLWIRALFLAPLARTAQLTYRDRVLDTLCTGLSEEEWATRVSEAVTSFVVRRVRLSVVRARAHPQETSQRLSAWATIFSAYKRNLSLTTVFGSKFAKSRSFNILTRPLLFLQELNHDKRVKYSKNRTPKRHLQFKELKRPC